LWAYWPSRFKGGGPPGATPIRGVPANPFERTASTLRRVMSTRPSESQMTETLLLEVVTPEKKVFCGHVTEVRFTTQHRGQYGVLPGHTPLFTLIGSGLLLFTIHGKEHWISLFGGIAEVRGDRVSILARESETVDSLDIDAIRSDQQRAEKAMREAHTDHDLAMAQVAIERSMVRMQSVNLAMLLGIPHQPRCAKCGCENCTCC
jgi:F-type H+-transporting ATPase subunit epsilon